MAPREQPHLLGIDDGPVAKFEEPAASAKIVGVMMEGPDLVEAVAVTEFPVDGDDVTSFLAGWIEGFRFRPALQGVLFKGLSIAGLGVVDVPALSVRLGLPVAIVNRRKPIDEPLCSALRSAGLADRIPIVERAPRPRQIDHRLFVASTGTDGERIAHWLQACRSKSELPEPLRLAHLIARAVATGESRGRP